MKKPSPKKRAPLNQPPHPLSGYYLDSTGKKYWVPPRPTFGLYRCKDDWEPVDKDNPVQDNAEHFERQISHRTFTRINH